MMRPAALLLALALAAPAFAQAGPEARRSYEAQASYPVEALSGVLGELHFLAFRCQGEDAQDWRATMLELLELEAPTRGPYRERLIEAFNDGFRYHERRGTRCGAEAEIERRRLAMQGRALSETLRREYID
ncbi:TIGR02301 family protein [Marinicauda algicola]|uniref:TIGR02301 family protein n=1 Tax=Marinicauda algicola TaxID=2029849 RepID=A0A4S2GZ46_9PROT|nr:TIGR02301 family protein [Marinicauda algicola]TGY88384.1 TIGR02301 family protein [Marinicauda algicola]